MKTGLPLLDLQLGGGLPAGITEVYGPSGTGRTCLGLSALREHQGPRLLMLSTIPDPVFIRAAGADCDIVLPDNIGVAVHVLTTACNAFPDILVVVDSLTHLECDLEIAQTLGTTRRRQLPYPELKQLAKVAERTGARVVLINELRQNIGAVRGTHSSLAHVCGIICRAQIKTKQIKYETAFGGLKQVLCSAHIEKSVAKFVPEDIEYTWRPDTGIDRGVELLRALVYLHHAKRSGPWWIFNTCRLGPGLELAAKAVNSRYEEFACLLNRLS